MGQIGLNSLYLVWLLENGSNVRRFNRQEMIVVKNVSLAPDLAFH